MFADAERMIFESGKTQSFFVRAAPRGFGKSRIISVVLPLWCIAYHYRKNIVLISDSNDLAVEFITAIKSEIMDNEKFIKDFGHLESDVKWSETEIVTSSDVRVIAKTSGKNIRGISYKNVRPDLVVLDDMENDEMVNTEEQRVKLRKWFTKVLKPLGGDGTCFLYVGSILHYDSLLNRILTRPEYSNWDRKIYQAIKEFSMSPLWEQWSKLFMDLSDKHAADTAMKFYWKHKDEMLTGTDVLWPEWKQDRKGDYATYYYLMIERLQDSDAFNSEYQNNPMTEDTRIFKEAWIKNNYYDKLPEMKEIYGSVDLSMGKSRTSDTSAILIVGRGIDNYFYILEADVIRRSPDKIIADIIKYIVKYEGRLTGFVVETNVFQEFFANTLEKTCVDMGLYVNWIERKSVAGENKLLRIKAIAPKIKLGYIKFNRYHQVLESQLKDFPKSHDDGPDALEMCITQFLENNGHLAFTCLRHLPSSNPINVNKIIKGWFNR